MAFWSIFEPGKPAQLTKDSYRSGKAWDIMMKAVFRPLSWLIRLKEGKGVSAPCRGAQAPTAVFILILIASLENARKMDKRDNFKICMSA
jgi:hypothetical protein